MEAFFREVLASIVRLGISLDVWPSVKGVSTSLLYDQVSGWSEEVLSGRSEEVSVDSIWLIVIHDDFERVAISMMKPTIGP